MIVPRGPILSAVRCLGALLLMLGALLAATTTTAHATPLPGLQPSNAQDGRIAAGNDHTCAIAAAGGTLHCWGSNSDGQRDVPADLGPVVQVTAGENDTCAVQADRTVRCWGSNASGQATVPADLGTVTSVDAGIDGTCAIKSDATAVCWGDPRLAPPANLGNVTEISVGDASACAAKPDGTVACWGASSFIRAVPSDLGTVTQISVGELHACAIKSGGTVACWGYDGSGQSTVPQDLGLASRVVASVNSCVIKADGTARCWGAPGGTLPTTLPAGVDPVLQLAIGVTHACALKATGTVACWGASDADQLAVPAGLGAVSRPTVAAGYGAVCATRSNGTVTCWGMNAPPSTAPAKAIYADFSTACVVSTDSRASCAGRWSDLLPVSLGPTVDIAFNSQGACALELSGTPKCWGDTNYFVIKNVRGAGRQIFLLSDSAGCLIQPGGTAGCWYGSAPTGNSLITRLDSGYFHTCWLDAANVTSCTGTIDAPPTGHFLDLDSGGTNACAIRSDGGVVCWGSDVVGESTVPNDLGRAVEVNANGAVNHVTACAVEAEGTVRCWGDLSLSATATRGLTDIVPPTTTDSVPDWSNGTVAVTLNATDTGGAGVATTTYEVISAQGVPGPTQRYSADAKPLLAAGERIRYRSTDASENVEADRTSQTFAVDQERPTTTDDVPTEWSKGPVAVTLDAADTGGSGLAQTTYEILSADGVPGPTQTYSVASKPVLAHGERIRYRSTDVAGNAPADRTSSAAKVDGAAPTSADDVPAAPTAAPVTVTLIATDVGPSGVETTTYEILGADGTAGPMQTYDPAAKPRLAPGEQIRYRSTDAAGNRETDRTSAVVTVPPPSPTPTPAPTLTPAPLPTLLPQTAPVLTATLGADGKGRQVLLAKKWVTVKVGCGPVACRLVIKGRFFVKGKRVASLKPFVVTLAAGERRLVRIPTSLNQRRIIRKLLGAKGTRGEARFTITGTTLTTPSTTVKTTVKVGLRQVVSQR